jgi:dTDP-4-dehydrorhamnose 3,5-epimerase
VLFHPTVLPDVLVVEAAPVHDVRGFFARTYGADEYRERGLEFLPVQAAISFNREAGTLRGLHFQAPPAAEAKLVRCTMGTIFDVAADVRPGSATFGRWVGVELSAANRRSLLVPAGVAHGFQTLEDETEVLYLISEPYMPSAERGVRWDDPTLAIEWPSPSARIISDRDRRLPLLGEEPATPHPDRERRSLTPPGP